MLIHFETLKLYEITNDIYSKQNTDYLVGVMERASAPRVGDQGSIPSRVITHTLNRAPAESVATQVVNPGCELESKTGQHLSDV